MKKNKNSNINLKAALKIIIFSMFSTSMAQADILIECDLAEGVETYAKVYDAKKDKEKGVRAPYTVQLKNNGDQFFWGTYWGGRWGSVFEQFAFIESIDGEIVIDGVLASPGDHILRDSYWGGEASMKCEVSL